MDMTRGKIRNRQYATQVRDFSGLRFRNITPTDIDGLIEYRNKGYVFIETKYRDAHLPDGQRLALERLCDDLERAGKPTLSIIASHSCNGDINVGDTTVSEYRFRYRWRQTRRETRTKDFVARFLTWLEKDFDV